MSYNPKPTPLSLDELTSFIDSELRDIASEMVVETQYNSSMFTNQNSVINQRLKQEGLRVWDVTSKKPLWARGKKPTDPWIDGSGTTVYIPV